MKTLRQRFRVKRYRNGRTGSISWRVSGTKRDGTRVRENYSEPKDAQLRHIELEGEYHARQAETTLRATRLTDTQIHLAELAFARLSDDADMPRAVDYWLSHGKQHHVSESPRIDDGFKRFEEWLEGRPSENGNGICTLRSHSRKGLRLRVKVFANSIGNLHVNEITPDTVENFLGKLRVSNVTRDNYRRALSRFFSWAIERPRRWTLANPCREIRVERGEKPPPAILTNEQCRALLEASAPKGLAPYVAVCVFGGLRPFEASRLDWRAVNLDDREIRLEGHQTKTGRPRVVNICETLLAWLRAHKGQPFFPSNWRKTFDSVKQAAGFGPEEREIVGADGKHAKEKTGLQAWPVDVMRHTAISHYFRKTGSYGQTAEQFGNSEAIIKAHYQGRVSTDDAAEFYDLLPGKTAKAKGRKKTKQARK